MVSLAFSKNHRSKGYMKTCLPLYVACLLVYSEKGPIALYNI